MIISFSKDFIFFKPIKTAGSSLEEAFWGYCDPIIDICSPDPPRPGYNWKKDNRLIFNHINLSQFLATGVLSLYEFKNNFHKITVCRNPWDKQVSSFWHVIDIQKRYQSLSLAEIEDRYLEDFAQYIRGICIGDGGKGQAELSANFFFYKNGQPFYNSIIRFESLQSDYDMVCNQLGLGTPTTLPKLKTSTRLLPYHYSNYYTEEIKELVGTTYQQAISHFGYNFERQENK